MTVVWLVLALACASGVGFQAGAWLSRRHVQRMVDAYIVSIYLAEEFSEDTKNHAVGALMALRVRLKE